MDVTIRSLSPVSAFKGLTAQLSQLSRAIKQLIEAITMLGWSQEDQDYEFNSRYDYIHEAYGEEARLLRNEPDYYCDSPALSEEEFAKSMTELEARLYPNGRKSIELDSGDIPF